MPDNSFQIKLGKLFHRRRHIFLYIPFMLVCLFSFWEETRSEVIIWSIGSGLMVIGLLIRLWSARHCGKRTIYKEEKGRWLTVSGPYACVRNPLYLANLIIGCGLIVLSGLLWLIPIFIVAGLLFYHLIVLDEEIRLLTHYGNDYETYTRNVPRWLPRFSRPADTSISAVPKLNPWSEIFRAERWRFLAIIGIVILISFKEYIGQLIHEI